MSSVQVGISKKWGKEDLYSQHPSKASRAVEALGSIMVDKNAIESEISEYCSTERSYFRWSFQPA